ncbi:MAG: DUF4194 domain-containing protein [Propionibacterium sp.]|nr:DUF4194 domain-containing protein [Propionibacterium sp.]
MSEPVDDATATVDVIATEAATATATAGEDQAPTPPDPFVDTVSMEADTGELFPGDRGVLDPEVRRVLVRLLQRRFLSAERSPADWKVLLENQQSVESRLGDLFVRLVVDHERGVAYKEQVRSEDLDIPILLRDEAYSRVETLVLVHLRATYQRESTSGEASARIDVEDVEQMVMTYFSEGDGTTAKRQKAIRGALERLRQDGIVEEESEGRFRISPLVEIVLSAERLEELGRWLREQSSRRSAGLCGGSGGEGESDVDEGGTVESHDAAESGDTEDETDQTGEVVDL